MENIEELQKRSELEKEFYRQREAFIHEVDTKQYVDEPTLFMSRQSVVRYLTRLKIFEKILDVKGSIIECGVHRGGSLMWFYHLASIYEPYNFHRRIYGFDTFEGFRSISEKDPHNIEEEWCSDTSYDVLQRSLGIHDLNRPISHIPKAELIRGDATITIPKFVKAHPELIIALLYLDFDLYEPTKVALQHFLPLIPKGGVVVFDELCSARWYGETIALKEAFNLNEVRLEHFPFDPWPSFFVIGS